MNSINIDEATWVKDKIANFNSRKYFVSIVKKGPLLDDIYKLRYRVYCLEKKYIPKNKAIDGKECDEYDSYSTHFGAIDVKTNQLVGTVRLVGFSKIGFPLEKEFVFSMSSELRRYRTVEVSRLAVDEKFRKSRTNDRDVLLLLLRSIVAYSNKKEIKYFIAAIDSDVFELLRSLGLSFCIIDRQKKYMGSESVPVMINIQEQMDLLKLVNPNLWQLIVKK